MEKISAICIRTQNIAASAILAAGPATATFNSVTGSSGSFVSLATPPNIKSVISFISSPSLLDV